MSIVDLGEKVLKMSLYFGIRSEKRCKLRGEVSKGVSVFRKQVRLASRAAEGIV